MELTLLPSPSIFIQPDAALALVRLSDTQILPAQIGIDAARDGAQARLVTPVELHSLPADDHTLPLIVV